VGQDADFFYFPAYAGKDLGKPVLGAGTSFMVMSDNPAAMELIKFLETPIAHEVWMAQSGFLTPHKGVNVDAYANDVLKKQGQMLLDATTFRFDASDLMPGGVGAGTFWTGMVDYVSGKDAATVTAEIQKSWDALK
jgi:alpha-glucoside transport system substrate-binding protein